MLNPDFRDMLSAFNAAGVEFLIVGGYAVAHYGYPRATGDLDFWVRRSPENADRVLRALDAFGAPAGLVTRDDLLDPEIVAQIGIEPNRVDILTAIDGVEFDDAYQSRVLARIDDVEIPFVGLHHLLQNKRATGRQEVSAWAVSTFPSCAIRMQRADPAALSLAPHLTREFRLTSRGHHRSGA